MSNSLYGKNGYLAASKPRPLVLSSNKYKQVVSVCNSGERTKKEVEENQLRRDYLKKGSNDLVPAWGTEGFIPTQVQMKAEKKHQIAALNENDTLETQTFKENDEQNHNEKTTNARDLIRKLKAPKKLQGSVMTSEILKGRTAQQTTKKINEDSFEDRYILDMYDKETKAQIIKEQEVLKRKRELMRKNALEAMMMTEQRKARDRAQDKIEEKVMVTYNDGRGKMKTITKEKEVTNTRQKLTQNENGRRLAAIRKDTSSAEEARYQRDVSTLQLQFTAQEKERVERGKQLKLQRIQTYYDELKAQKEKELQKKEETRLAMANRFKNEEINVAFSLKLEKDKLNNIDQIRNDLSTQIEKHKNVDVERRAYEQNSVATSYEKDDKFFLEFVDRLSCSAVRKERRPVFPFVKTARNYKRVNHVLGKPLPECGENPTKISPHKYGLDELKSLNPYLLDF